MKVIEYGQYPQIDNKVMPIEWYILSEGNGKLLLISKYAIDCHSFHYDFGSCVLWQNSAIREWLNRDFYLQAFSMEERGNIVQTLVSQYYDNNIGHWGKSTIAKDKVFLLSANELREFMPKDLRGCIPTDFALTKYRFIYPYLEHEECEWWIRNSGLRSDDIALCLSDGTIDMQGCANGFVMYVRPAIRIVSPFAKNGDPAPQELNMFTGCWTNMLRIGIDDEDVDWCWKMEDEK